MQWIWIVFVLISVVTSISANKKKAEEEKRAKSSAGENSAVRSEPNQNQTRNQATRNGISSFRSSLAGLLESIDVNELPLSDANKKSLSRAVNAKPLSQFQPAHKKPAKRLAPLTVSPIAQSTISFSGEGEDEAEHRRHESETAHFYEPQTADEPLDLSFGEDDIVNAIVYSEILGRPKSRRVAVR